MRNKQDEYYHLKKEIGKILNSNGLEMMSKDFSVLDRIFNWLSEGIHISKIEGYLLSTQITTYGGDMENDKAKDIYNEILAWWETCDIH